MSAAPEPFESAALALLTSLLKIPPFPGARITSFKAAASAGSSTVRLDHCIASMVAKRVGGTFWGWQPPLPDCYFVVRGGEDEVPQAVRAGGYGQPLLWPVTERTPGAQGADAQDRDPWHMLSAATAVVCGPDDEVRIIAEMLRLPVFLIGVGVTETQASSRLDEASNMATSASFLSPFSQDVLPILEAIDLLAFWRMLTDANRGITKGLGFAFWKQSSVLPLLWSSSAHANFFSGGDVEDDGAVAVWRSKASSAAVARLERAGTLIVEVEDGFLRSAGLGADCIPPLSISVDWSGAYFDPAQPSELELLLQRADFDQATISRAQAIRRQIVAAGLGKYERGGEQVERFAPGRRHILVAGQVEDDRSIITGGCGLASNTELLRRVRASEPDAFIIYKPHPDVLAGHRKGLVNDQNSRLLADKVVTDLSISSLIDMVDDVHVITSLAGFEALMRGKSVTTHGVPFYAGWGLTNDLGPVPTRRSRRRTLDELVAASLLLYPRYLDPESGLPCPAEVVVDRLIHAPSGDVGLLVRLRRLQGRLRARLAAFSVRER